jgi:hypothetical protein
MREREREDMMMGRPPLLPRSNIYLASFKWKTGEARSIAINTALTKLTERIHHMQRSEEKSTFIL